MTDPVDYERDQAPRVPRWVKIVGIVAAVLVLLVIIVMLVGGGHGPRRHGSLGVSPISTVGSGGIPSWNTL